MAPSASGHRRGDRLLITIALLTLLADLAEESRVLVLVDDPAWLDTPSAEALPFVAGSLETEPIVMLFARHRVG